MKYIDLTNEVLALLREDKIPGNSFDSASEYQKLVGKFVDFALKEVEDKWLWSVYNSRITYPLTPASYTAMTVATETVDRASRMQLLSAKVLRDNIETPIQIIPYTEFSIIKNSVTNPPTSTIPQYTTMRNLKSDPRYVEFLIYPKVSDSNSTYVAYVYDPSPRLTQDTIPVTGGDYEIKIPSIPIIWKAYILAVSERGEDGSISVNNALMNYYTSLNDSILVDSQRSGRSLKEWRID